MAIADLLAQIGNQLSISGVPSLAQPGQHVIASLVPDLSSIKVTDIVEQDISLDLIAKDVVFSNTDVTDPGFVEDDNITKALPFFNFASVTPTLDTGVPGLVGKLKGKFPIAVPANINPTLTAKWKVEDNQGNTLGDFAHFFTPAGLNNPTLDIIFIPEFSEYDGADPGTVIRNIFVHIELSVANEPPFTRDIGPVRVIVPKIAFPKVLALSRDKDFQGPALIIVPGSSAITSLNHIKTLLQPVRTAISLLNSLAFLADMLVGIDTLSGVLESTSIAFSKADPINNLNNITILEKRFWFDQEAEDEMSSFIYLSPATPFESTRHQVEFCNDRSLKDDEGKFTVKPGVALVVLCRDLHSKTPGVIPVSAKLTVNKSPTGWRWGTFLPHKITSFGDELSSINFL